MQIINSCIFALLYLIECVVYCGTSAVVSATYLNFFLQIKVYYKGSVTAVAEVVFSPGTDTSVWMQCVLLCTV